MIRSRSHLNTHLLAHTHTKENSCACRSPGLYARLAACCSSLSIHGSKTTTRDMYPNSVQGRPIVLILPKGKEHLQMRVSVCMYAPHTWNILLLFLLSVYMVYLREQVLMFLRGQSHLPLRLPHIFQRGCRRRRARLHHLRFKHLRFRPARHSQS